LDGEESEEERRGILRRTSPNLVLLMAQSLIVKKLIPVQGPKRQKHVDHFLS